MKKLFTLILALLAFATGAKADVEITASNFPDAAFRETLLNYSYGKDGVITDAEIAKITEFFILYEPDLQSLKGIEYFTELENLVVIRCNLQALEVSKNKKLTSVTIIRNSIGTTEMGKLVNSLPMVAEGELTVTGEVEWMDDERNRITAEQIIAANSKGWKVCTTDDIGDPIELRASDLPTAISFNETNFHYKTPVPYEPQYADYTCSPSSASDYIVYAESSNPAVVSVEDMVMWSSNSVAFYAIGVGKATVTITTINDLSASFTVTVDGEYVGVSDVQITPSGNPYLFIGETYQLAATVLPSNASYPEVTWTSSDNSVATVSSTGLVTAVGEGYAKIYAEADGKEDWISVGVMHKGPVEGTLGTQGTWSFKNGVLTVDYVGAMPQNCTSKTTDPEIAYRLKWIDFLSEIKEIVITGVDVEVQPYFLYYSGDGDLGQHPDDHIKKLTLGSGVKKVGKQAFASYDLKDVYCYGIEPPVLSSDTGGGNVFWKKRIQANQAFLHLVQGASTGYAMINSEWAIFNHSAHALDPEDDPVEIVSPLGETEEGAGAWYSLDGRKLGSKPTMPGLYIKDAKKVVVK